MNLAIRKPRRHAPVARPALAPAPADDRDVEETTALPYDLRASLAEGSAFSVMVGVGETYLSAFVLAMGLGEVTAGLIAAVPLMAGGVLQLISPMAVEWLCSHRRWVVLCAFTQALSFLPLAIAAYLGHISAFVAFLIASVYWGAGMATGPAWNTWMGTIIPTGIRAKFFADRTRLCQACVLAGFLCGGIALQGGAIAGTPLFAFALIFLLACGCRCVSSALLASQSEPEPLPSHHRRLTMGETLHRVLVRSDGRLLLYFLAVQMAVQISGPYFSPYMLAQLHLSYASYTILIAVAYVAKILALPWLGRYAQRHGAHRLLWLGGIGIVPVASLWLLSNQFSWFVCIQAFGGVAWAAYELAMFLLFFEAVRPEERTSVLTTFNFLQSLATVAGSLLGGAYLTLLDKAPSAYLTLFAISSLCRFGTLFLLARAPVSDATPTTLPALRTLAVRPMGSMVRPILSSVTAGRPTKKAA